MSERAAAIRLPGFSCSVKFGGLKRNAFGNNERTTQWTVSGIFAVRFCNLKKKRAVNVQTN